MPCKYPLSVSIFVRLSVRHFSRLSARLSALFLTPFSTRFYVLICALFLATSNSLAGPLISIASGPSNRAQINAQLVLQALNKAGFKAQIKQLEFDQWADAVRTGKVHILPEVSAAQLSTDFTADITNGVVVDMGPRQANKSDPSYRKVAWSKTRRRWTNEYKLIKIMTIPEAETLKMLDAVKREQPVKDVVAAWLSSNQARWNKWNSVSRNWMKP